MYLSTVDARLQSSGLDHLRYVDDIRVFCNQFGDALQAVERVTETLASCGLNIQSAKTNILRVSSGEARKEIDGVAPAIEGVRDALLNEIDDLALDYVAIIETEEIESAAYVTLEQLEEIACASPEAPTAEVLECAWVEHVNPETVQTVSKTLLRYLLNRLGRVRSEVAMELLPQIIAERPEELEICLRYLGRAGRDSHTVERLPDLIDYDGYTYDRSLFGILKWAWSERICTPRLLELARDTAADQNRSSWTRAYAWAFLAREGSGGDLDLLLDLYSGTSDVIEHSELVCCTARMEISRRNAFLSRVAGECMWTQWASQAVQSGAIDSLMTPQAPD